MDSVPTNLKPLTILAHMGQLAAASRSSYSSGHYLAGALAVAVKVQNYRKALPAFLNFPAPFTSCTQSEDNGAHH